MRLRRPPSPTNAPADFRSPVNPNSPGTGVVYVAVGRSTAKTLALLQWTFRQFGCREVGLVHVHQPSLTIPTLLGRLPVKQANEELVAAYRILERKEAEKILQSYRSFCQKSQVNSEIIMTEAAQIQKGIVELIIRYGIRKLVMGATSDTCFRVKGRFSKVPYAAQNTPAFCEIWFVSKGKHFWTRDASEGIDDCLPFHGPGETVLRERIWSSSVQSCSSNSTPNSENFSFESFTATEIHGGRSSDLSEHDNAKVGISITTSPNPTCMNSMASCLTLASGKSSAICPKVHGGLELEGHDNRLQEVMMEIETSKKEASTELAKRKELESITAEASNRVKASEAASSEEAKIIEQLQDIFKTTKMQREGLVCYKDEAMRELQNAKTSIALLDGRAKEMARRCKEAAGELELIQSSIGALLLATQRTQERRKKSVPQFERWRCSNYARFPNCGLIDHSVNFTEFSALDLQTATCGFSESFKLGHGGYECVYKGEILNRTVVIRKLHLHNVQGQNEFQQEVYVLGKLRHPHLVSLIGVCPELLSLVYEYLPNGSLHYRLFCRTPTLLTWMVRTRTVAEISSALLFLHSCKPERIIHGNLKLDNIYLDSNLNCKIGDFGICRFVPEDTRNYPLFQRTIEPKGSFPYTDPEYQRTGVLTPKSDVYTFGIVILQLLTGKPPVGLTSEVRRAVLSNTLPLILDITAGEWPSDVATKLANFGLRCSEMNSRDRPDLTPEVVKELKQLHLMEERPVPPFFLCPILQEIMHDPQVAADGFTYEGSALRGWLESGRGTSPMTNLKLDHLNLTPNHALRLAIQDWLCQPCQ